MHNSRIFLWLLIYAYRKRIQPHGHHPFLDITRQEMNWISEIIIRAPIQYKDVIEAYRKSHCGDTVVVRSSYPHNGIFYTGTMAFWYWIGALKSSLLLYIENAYTILGTDTANLRDLIAATGLVILLKLDSDREFFSSCDFEIWWMTSKNNRAPLLYHIKLCASLQIHQWIQTGFTVLKRSIRVKIGDFLSRVTLKFDGWHWKTIGHILSTMLSFVHNCNDIGLLKLELQSGNAQFGSKSVNCSPVWPWNLMDDLEK